MLFAGEQHALMFVKMSILIDQIDPIDSISNFSYVYYAITSIKHTECIRSRVKTFYGCNVCTLFT